LAALVAVLALFFLIKTNSKTSIFLGLSTVTLCSVYYFVIGRDRRIATIMLLALGLFVGGGALWAGLTMMTTDQVAYAVRDVSLSGRVTIWHAIVTMIQDRPWIGHGFGSFWQTQDLLNGFGARTHLSEMEKWIDNAHVINQAHSGYLDLLLSVGIVGLVLVVGAHFMALARLQKLIRRPDVRRSDRYAFMAVHSSILTILLNNFLESTLFYSPFYSIGALMMVFLVYTNTWHAMGRYTAMQVKPAPDAAPLVVAVGAMPVRIYAMVGQSRKADPRCTSMTA
jgi:O-antigen ligase